MQPKDSTSQSSLTEEYEIDSQQELYYKDTIAKLEKKLRDSYRESNLAQALRDRCFRLAKETIAPPNWLITETQSSPNAPGTPTLFLSDWHWSEIVRPEEVNFKNAFNLEIAKARAKYCIEASIEVLFKHAKTPEYPGLVLALGGDMISGSIHDELKESNEIEVMPTVIDIVEVLVWAINELCKYFERIFIPCVTGNHGRYTRKIRMKQRAFQSYDWLIYTFLDKIFQKNKQVQFFIPEGPDALYQVHNVKYLLTHGDSLGRGGDGLIGPIGPITRGDHRRRTRNTGLGLSYDVLICGHFHQLMMLRSRIINGSLKGLDEYAYTQAFGYEPPMQALWLTHPKRGITYSTPVFCSDSETNKILESSKTSWISYYNNRNIKN